MWCDGCQKRNCSLIEPVNWKGQRKYKLREQQKTGLIAMKPIHNHRVIIIILLTYDSAGGAHGWLHPTGSIRERDKKRLAWTSQAGTGRRLFRLVYFGLSSSSSSSSDDAPSQAGVGPVAPTTDWVTEWSFSFGGADHYEKRPMRAASSSWYHRWLFLNLPHHHNITSEFKFYSQVSTS